MENSSILNQENQEPSNESSAPSIWDGMEVKWPEGIDESIKESNTLKKYVTDGGEFNYANMMKSFVHLDRMRGNMIKLPEHLETEEEKDKFYERVLGFKPSDLESYKPELPEETKLAPEFFEEFKKVLHKNRIPVETAKEVGEFIENQFGGFLENIEAKKAQSMQEGIENLKHEWGEGFDKNLNYAREVINNFGDDNMRQYLDKSGLGNDPELIKFLSGVGRKIYTETELHERVKSTTNFGLTPQEAKEKITNITGNMTGPYWDASHPHHKKSVEEVTKMYEVLNKSNQRNQKYGF